MISKGRSLNDVDDLYRGGHVTEEEVLVYLREWNNYPSRFTQAVLADGGIRTYDTAGPCFYSADLRALCGARGRE